MLGWIKLTWQNHYVNIGFLNFLNLCTHTPSEARNQVSYGLYKSST